MHKQAFINYLAKKNRRPQRFYQDALSEILAGLQEQLAKGNDVRLVGFGTFYTRTHTGGKGRNFKTKQQMEYKPIRQAAFKPGSLLKQAVRRKQGLFSRYPPSSPDTSHVGCDDGGTRTGRQPHSPTPVPLVSCLDTPHVRLVQ